jgi:hypothetical protein
MTEEGSVSHQSPNLIKKPPPRMSELEREIFFKNLGMAVLEEDKEDEIKMTGQASIFDYNTESPTMVAHRSKSSAE